MKQGGGAEGYKFIFNLRCCRYIGGGVDDFRVGFRCEEAMKNRYPGALCIRRGEQLCAVAGFHPRCTEVNFL